MPAERKVGDDASKILGEPCDDLAPQRAVHEDAMDEEKRPTVALVPVPDHTAANAGLPRFPG
jgi:hypothetical protein